MPEVYWITLPVAVHVQSPCLKVSLMCHVVASSVSSRCTTEDEDVVIVWLVRGEVVEGRTRVLLSFEGGGTWVQ